MKNSKFTEEQIIGFLKQWSCPVSTDTLSLFIEAQGLSGFRS